MSNAVKGVIVKALSGFYYVDVSGTVVTCRARGKFRHKKITPLVGDWVNITQTTPTEGMVDEILPRQNAFHRPAVANIEQLVIIASGAIPITDPFLIDRVTSLAESKGCEPILCINKWDLTPAQELFDIYHKAGFQTLQVSAQTGQGIEELSHTISGKVCAFTGNSGVGKSSILNALEPTFGLEVGTVSEKLGRGRHTTRHVELFRLGNGALVADTPGFSSFDEERSDQRPKEELQHSFREFLPYLDQCRYVGCAHVKESGCAVLAALSRGDIGQSRHNSYVRLYEQAKEYKAWEK